MGMSAYDVDLDLPVLCAAGSPGKHAVRPL